MCCRVIADDGSRGDVLASLEHTQRERVVGEDGREERIDDLLHAWVGARRSGALWRPRVTRDVVRDHRVVRVERERVLEEPVLPLVAQRALEGGCGALGRPERGVEHATAARLDRAREPGLVDALEGGREGAEKGPQVKPADRSVCLLVRHDALAQRMHVRVGVENRGVAAGDVHAAQRHPAARELAEPAEDRAK